MFFSACLAVFLIVSAGLLAHEANFAERHGSEFTSWFSDRLVGAVVRITFFSLQFKPFNPKTKLRKIQFFVMGLIVK